MPKRYDVTIPRTYKDANNNEKTHFWHVGSAFPLREKDGFTIKLYSRMLLSDQFVVFAREEKEQTAAEPDDDLPF